eukprot:16810-Pelagomonas_calceolata.AAC.1
MALLQGYRVLGVRVFGRHAALEMILAPECRSALFAVSDFGLSVYMDHLETHVSSLFHGTLTHMAPEVMLEGTCSKASDVYARVPYGGKGGGMSHACNAGASDSSLCFARQKIDELGIAECDCVVAPAWPWILKKQEWFGIVLWELFTCDYPFRDVPPALLGHSIVKQGQRPAWPSSVPKGYRDLANACWDQNPDARCGERGCFWCAAFHVLVGHGSCFIDLPAACERLEVNAVCARVHACVFPHSQLVVLCPTVLHPLAETRWILHVPPNSQRSRTPAALRKSKHSEMANLASGHWGSVLVGRPFRKVVQADAGSDIALRLLHPLAT